MKTLKTSKTTKTTRARTTTSKKGVVTTRPRKNTEKPSARPAEPRASVAPVVVPVVEAEASEVIVPVAASRRMLEDQEDRRLAKLVADDDQEAWRVLYERWSCDLRRFGASQGWERDLVDDLVQDTLIRAWAKRKDYDPKYPYRVWILTIFRRLAMTQYRRVKTHARVVGTTTTRSQASEGPWWAERDTTMASNINQIDAQSMIAPVLAKLKESDQKLLAAWSNLTSQRELAESMGINPVTLRTKIMRAKMRLREAFAKEYPDVMEEGWAGYSTLDD